MNGAFVLIEKIVHRKQSTYNDCARIPSKVSTLSKNLKRQYEKKNFKFPTFSLFFFFFFLMLFK